MADNNIRREFSYTRPIWYNGESYPSADSLISDEYGNKTKGSIFADANGQYYALDKDRNILPVIPVNNLDEVVVTAQNKQVLPTMFSNYLTMSNDRTKVNNLPHREYNTHLKERTERGAKEHSLWDKEHPNLSAWRDFTTAIPFGVAATPLVGGGGSALLETGMGQAAKQGLAAFMENPYVASVNDAIGLGFAGKGSYDVTQGKFTPETALDILGGAGLMYKGLNAWDKATVARRTARNLTEPSIIREEPIGLSSTPARVENTEPILSRLQDPNALERVRNDINARTIFNNTSESQRTIQENNIPSRLLEDYDNSIAQPNEHWQDTARATNDDTELPFFPDGTENPNYRFVPDNFGPTPFEEGNPLDNIIIGNVEDVDLFSDVPSNESFFKVRNVKNGDIPYTDEEINALVDENGFLKDGITFENRVNTGAHGYFYNSGRGLYKEDTPTEVLRKYLALNDPNNPHSSMKEMRRVRADNPKGRSGILLDTHSGDTSVDSSPLAYHVATTLGKNFKPLEGAIDTNDYTIPWKYKQDFKDRGRILSNDFGYKNLFKTGYSAEAKRAKAIFAKNPEYEAKLLRDKSGNMIAFELADEEGTFQIPLNTRQETLNAVNEKLHEFNDYFGTKYSDVVPFMNKERVVYDPNNPYPWYFGESYDLPNIYGIIYKNGGKLKRRLLTSL